MSCFSVSQVPREALLLKQGRGTEVYFGSGLVTLFSLGDKKQLIAASAVSPPSPWHVKLRRDFRCLPACLLDEPLGLFAYRSYIHASHDSAYARARPMGEVKFDRVLTWYNLNFSSEQFHDISRDL